MADENIVLEHLKHIRGKVDRIADDVRETKTRLGDMETQYAGLSRRVDRIDTRVERIENRLDLAPAA